MITRTNEICRNLARIYKLPEPTRNSGLCTLCNSVTAEFIEWHLTEGGDCSWIEPASGTWVQGVWLSNGQKFLLKHLYDEPLTDSDAERIMGIIENHAGNLELYIKDLIKWGK